MLKINKKISPYNHYNGRDGIKYIVIHGTDNINDTAKNNVDYFSRANRGASAHYFVDDNSIWESVEDRNGAWHVGDGHGRYGISNMNSIGIEMCGTDNGNYSDKTVSNTIELTKYLMNKYDIDINHVVRHYDASRKNCPSRFSPNNWRRWWEFKKRLGGKSNVASSSSSSNSSVMEAKEFVGSKCKELQELLIKAGYKCGGYGADGKFGQGTYNSLIAFQRDYGLATDGLAGKNTFAKLKEITGRKSNLVSQHGKCTVTVDKLMIREKPSTSSNTVGSYSRGESVNYDYYVDNEGYRWISWIGASGKRRYMAVRVLSNNKRYGHCV